MPLALARLPRDGEDDDADPAHLQPCSAGWRPPCCSGRRRCSFTARARFQREHVLALEAGASGEAAAASPAAAGGPPAGGARLEVRGVGVVVLAVPR